MSIIAPLLVILALLGAPLFAVQVYASDAGGQGRYPLPLPAAPGLAGVTLYAQSVWDWGPSSCSPTPIGWSSTHGLAVTVQP